MKFKFNTLLCIIGAIFLTLGTSVVSAETMKGSSELSIYGNGFDSSGFRQVSASIDYGYYFTNQVRGIFGVSAFGDIDEITVGGRAGLVYDFSPQGNTWYIGAVGDSFDVTELRDSSFGYVYLGYRNWVGENTAFFVQGGYARAFRGSGDATLAEFGLTVFFN